MILTPIGKVIKSSIEALTKHISDTELWNFVVMPNHIHMVIAVGTRHGASASNSPNGASVSERPNRLGCLNPRRHESPESQDFHHNSRLAVIIGQLKSTVKRITNKENRQFAWQSRYHEHIIRTQRAYENIMNYIDNNVERWGADCFNDNATPTVRTRHGASLQTKPIMKHNWEYKRLGDVCNILMGQSPSSDSYNDEAKGLPFFQGCSDFGKIYPSATKYCSVPIRVASENDILFSVRAPIGTMNIANLPCCIGRGLCSFRIHEPNLQKYLFYVLNVTKPKIIEKGTGSTFKAVGKDVLHNHTIPVPPLEVQEQIVMELDKITEVIDDCRELLRNFDDLTQSLYYDYFGDAVNNPNGWQVKQLGDLCDIVGRIGFRGYTRSDLVNKGEGAITLSPSNIVNGNLNYDNCSYISWYKYEESPEIKIFNGDVLLTKTGSTVGKVGCVFNLPEKATINPQLVVLKNLSINNRYLTFTLRDSAYQNIIREKSGGSAVPTISQKILATIAIPVPPLTLQEKFASRIEQIEAQKKAVEETMANLQTLLNSRMDYWFN